MNLHQLRIFYLVAKHGSVSRAADVLSLGQPNLSLQLKKLEKEFGLPLIEQAGRKLHLTEAGRVLHVYASQIFSLEREAEGAMDSFRGLSRGGIMLGAIPTASVYLLPPLLVQFARLYPKVSTAIEVDRSPGIIDKVLSQELDMAVVSRRHPLPPRLEKEFLVPEQMVVVCHPEHPLYKSPQPIAASDLNGQPFVLRELGSDTRNLTENALTEMGIRLNVALTLPNNETIKEAVKGRLGLSIMSELKVQAEIARGELAVLSVKGYELHRGLTLIWRADRKLSASAVALRDHIRKGAKLWPQIQT